MNFTGSYRKKKGIHIIPSKISFEHVPRNREKPLMLLLILLKYRQTSAVPVKNEFYYFAKLGFSKNLIIEGTACAKKKNNVKLTKGTCTRL